MDILLLVKAAILGIVEGLTEFLPISSTGHLILAGSLIGFTGQNASTFEIVIQTGAILAVIWEYRARIVSTLAGLATERRAQTFALNVVIAFLPAAVIGVAFSKVIKEHLFQPRPVAAAFVVGALIILWVERRHRRLYGERDLEGMRHARIETVDDMTPLDALKVGIAQCAGLIPGTSRSGATIIGGMLFGLSRTAATEFSFFLAIPTLIGAAVYSLYKESASLSWADAPVFGVGSVFAFISAFLCIRWLLRFVSTHDFTGFAWYRIAFGLIVLATFGTGWLPWHT